MIFVLYLRNFYLTQGHINFILPFFSNFIVSSSTFEFFIHFEIIFMYGWGSGQSHLFIYVYIYLGFTVQFSSVAQLCPTPCSPMNCSTPGLPVHHQLPEFTQTHVHQVGDAMQPSHPLLSPSPPAPNPSQHQSLFQWVNSSHEVAKVLEFQL